MAQKWFIYIHQITNLRPLGSVFFFSVFLSSRRRISVLKKYFSGLEPFQKHIFNYLTFNNL